MNCSNARTAYFDDVAATWDSAQGTDGEERLRSWWSEAAHDFSGSDALIVDLGCGTGISSHMWASALGRHGAVVAIDRSLEMVQVGRSRHDHRRIRWICGDAHELPLQDCEADVVVALHLWPHLDDEGEALAEWRRVLKPEGKLWIVHLSSRAKVNAIHASGGKAIRRDRLLPVGELAAKVRASGFRIERTQDDDDRYFLEASRV